MDNWQCGLARIAATVLADCLILQVCLDATGQVCAYGWQLHAIIAPDDFGEAVPLAYCITSSEKPEPITQFLNAVVEANPSFSPRVIVIDKSGKWPMARGWTGLATGSANFKRGGSHA